MIVVAVDSTSASSANQFTFHQAKWALHYVAMMLEVLH